MQRNVLIALLALALVGLGIGAYFYFFTGPVGVTVAPSGSASLPIAGQSTGNAFGNASQAMAPGAFPAGQPVAVSPRLVQISAGPIVPGEIVVNNKPLPSSAPSTASSTPDVAIQYIERQSGNIFSYLAHAKMLTRVNNKTLPGIQAAVWLPDASAALVRYLSGIGFSTINTYALAATSTNGFFLPQNLSDIVVSPTGILSLASGVNGSIGSLAHLDGSRATTVFTTPLTALRISFAGKNQYLAYSKPSASLPGDAFLIDSTGHFSRIAGPLNGLVALPSPLGKLVLVSYISGTTLQMELVNVATGVILPLPIATIADKCVWTANDAAIFCGVPVNPPASFSYPDDWYQGAVQFSDQIWKIDVVGRYAQLALDFSQANKGDLDAEALAIDPLGTTLVFINKNDESLWGYSL